MRVVYPIAANPGGTRIRSVTADVLIGLALMTVIVFSAVGQSPTNREGPLESSLRMLGIKSSASIEVAAFTPWQVWATSNGYRDTALAPLTTSRAALSGKKGHQSAYVLLGLLFAVLLAADVMFLGYLRRTYAAQGRRRCNQRENEQRVD